MIQELKYNGITTVPSDYECPDGDMSGMINAVIEDGVVRPLCPPTPIYTPSPGFTVKYIHKVGERTNYILTNESDLYWYNGVGEIRIEIPIPGIPRIKSINSIGNTLVVIADEGIHYILWSIEEQKYKYLGDHIPHLDISFGLQGHVRFFSISREDDLAYDYDKRREGFFKFTFDSISGENKFGFFSDENKKKITDQVLAKVNLFIQQQTIEKGRFCFPFFVRYALRLYDGTLVNHSAPILMMPSTTECPLVFVHEYNTNEAQGDIMLVASDIDYLVLPSQTELKEKWGDIVKSVAVFISKPIYSYDQNGECKRFIDTKTSNTRFIGKPFIKEASNAVGEDILHLLKNSNGELESDTRIMPLVQKYYEWDWYDFYYMFRPLIGDGPKRIDDENMKFFRLELPIKEEETISDSIIDNSQFYLLKELNIEDLSFDTTDRTIIEVGEEYLQSLTSREVMTDDYLTNDRLLSSKTFVYNQRLNMGNIKRELYKGFNPYSMFTYVEGAAEFTRREHNKDDGTNFYNQGLLNSIGRNNSSQTEMRVEVLIEDASGDKIVRNEVDYENIPIGRFFSTSLVSPFVKQSWGSFLFYPNANAKKITIYDKNGSTVASIPYSLDSHSFLNGAYHFIGFHHDRIATYQVDNSMTLAKAIVSDPNKVYTSEINNPFYFPVTGINTIGTGEILGISSAVKALSQGQFGQFPMYVFATDGVWALETSASGTFTAKQPVTRDVCICPESITQVDSAVLFATDRGVMMLQGSTANCISLDLDKDAQDLTAFPHLIELLNKHDYPIPSVDSNFKEYVKDCRMVYDYVNQRIIVANPNATYAYVYSMKSNKWGMIKSTIVDSINSYPEAYAVGKDGGLLDYSNPKIKDVKATLVTRPIKFDAPNDLKTIRTIVQRGMIERRDVKFILYGSRDLVNWYALASTTTSFLKGISGTPYKYFRLAIMADLKEDKSIYGATIDVEPKYNNRIR